jgi:hypothetical protein
MDNISVKYGAADFRAKVRKEREKKKMISPGCF